MQLFYIFIYSVFQIDLQIQIFFIFNMFKLEALHCSKYLYFVSTVCFKYFVSTVCFKYFVSTVCFKYFIFSIKSIYLSIYLLIYLSIYLSIFLSIYPSISMYSVYLEISEPILCSIIGLLPQWFHFSKLLSKELGSLGFTCNTIYKYLQFSTSKYFGHFSVFIDLSRQNRFFDLRKQNNQKNSSI